jgi:hypothetical protein
MKLLFLILTSILLRDPELALYKNDSYRFEVQFPQQHEEEIKVLEQKFATIELLVLSGQEIIQEGDLKVTVGYKVIASRYQPNEKFKQSGVKFQDLVYDYAKQSNKESFLISDLIILSEKYSKDALLFIVADQGMKSVTHRKIFIRDKMTYSLSIVAPPGFLTREQVQNYFNSLKIKSK